MTFRLRRSADLRRADRVYRRPRGMTRWQRLRACLPYWGGFGR